MGKCRVAGRLIRLLPRELIQQKGAEHLWNESEIWSSSVIYKQQNVS